jgi:hypothetical protein
MGAALDRPAVRHHNPEDHKQNNHHHENLRTYLVFFYVAETLTVFSLVKATLMKVTIVNKTGTSFWFEMLETMLILILNT